MSHISYVTDLTMSHISYVTDVTMSHISYVTDLTMCLKIVTLYSFIKEIVYIGQSRKMFYCKN